jgi:outer membrane protein
VSPGKVMGHRLTVHFQSSTPRCVVLKGSKLALIACLIAVPFSLDVNAEEVKIGYVNIERIFREAPAAIRGGKKLNQDFETRKQELQRMADDIKSQQSALSEKGKSLPDSERRAKEADMAESSVRFQRRQKELQEEIKVRQNEETSALLQKANKAIIQIAESENLDIVLQEAIAVSGRVDITEKVIKKLTAD